jgi:hypothetical protein
MPGPHHTIRLKRAGDVVEQIEDCLQEISTEVGGVDIVGLQDYQVDCPMDDHTTVTIQLVVDEERDWLYNQA